MAQRITCSTFIGVGGLVGPEPGRAGWGTAGACSEPELRPEEVGDAQIVPAAAAVILVIHSSTLVIASGVAVGGDGGATGD